MTTSHSLSSSPGFLSQCASVKEARVHLAQMVLTDTPFNEQFAPAQLHWILADKNECIVIEPMADGLHIYDNPDGVLTNNPPFPQQLFSLNNYMTCPRSSRRIHFLPICRLQPTRGWALSDFRETSPPLPGLYGSLLQNQMPAPAHPN